MAKNMKKLLVPMLLISIGNFAHAMYQPEAVYSHPVRRCCTDAQAYSTWFAASPDRAWREENISPNNFSIYRRSEDRPISFTDLAEQPATSGFERSVYTSPK